MTFDSTYNLLLEGLFHLPKRVLQPVMDYWMDGYKKVKVNNIKRITEKSFPPKIIPVDLHGTKYEFLHQLGNLSVQVQMTSDETSYFQELQDISQPNRGKLLLSVKNPVDMMAGTIEHEMLHYIQFLIQRYGENVKGHRNARIGGLPPKHMIPKTTDDDGYILSKGKRVSGTRIIHGRRPTEFYTNLLSGIRRLQYFYKDNSEGLSRKEFLIKFLKGEIETRMLKGFHSRLEDMKGFNLPLYRRLLKIIYNSFVNGNDEIDVKEIWQLISDAETARLEKEKSKARTTTGEEKIFEKSFTLDTHDDLFELSNLDDGNFDFAWETASNLPYSKIKYNKHDTEKWIVSGKWKHFMKIVEQLKKMRDREKDPELQNNYDYFLKGLTKHLLYAHSIDTNSEYGKKVMGMIVDKYVGS